MSALSVGRFRGWLEFATLSLSLYVNWVRGGQPRAEDRGGHVTTFISPALAPVLVTGASGHSTGRPGCP